MFFSIPNLSATAVTPIPEPWNYEPKEPVPYHLPKGEFTTWSQQFTTRHAFISMNEGMSDMVRVSPDDNPVFQIHGLLVDYDTKLPDDPVAFVKERAQCEFMPTHVVRTKSGNGRLVWQFERPLMVASEKQLKAFISEVNRRMKLSKWMAGIDTGALGNVKTYYEIGTEWMPVDPDSRIPKSHTEMWLFVASKDLVLAEREAIAYKIPIEDLANEVAERYPGRWKGEFVVGARGVRFWDPSADNDTAAIVREDGMTCFTGTQAFVSWKQIFGTEFVQKYEAEHVAELVNDALYDGRAFWVRNDHNEWVEWSKEDFSQDLRVRGYSQKRNGRQPASEIDIIENQIKKNNKVAAALPFLFFKSGKIRYNGQWYLNTSRVRPINPGPPCTDGPMTFSDGRKHFPFLYKLLTTMFTDDSDENNEQLTGLLAWLKYFYENSLNQDPRPGHTIVLAGPAGKGKTLFNRRVVGGLMGGYADASDHLVDGSQWTARLVDSAVMAVDDSRATADGRAMRGFTSRLKKYVANAEILYNQKYKQEGAVPWYGRTIITCNVDADSLLILPNMDVSTKDKISLFRTSDHVMDFPEQPEIEKSITQQLPAFARFLLDWVIPSEWLDGERRFGIRPYHHPELFEEARQQGLGDVLETLHGFVDNFMENNATAAANGYWEGTATQLHQDMITAELQYPKRVTARALATQLGIMRKNGYKLFKFKSEGTNLTIWRIPRDFYEQKEDWDGH